MSLAFFRGSFEGIEEGKKKREGEDGRCSSRRGEGRFEGEGRSLWRRRIFDLFHGCIFNLKAMSGLISVYSLKTERDLETV